MQVRKTGAKEKRKVFDPRFSDMHGTLDTEAVARNYSFLDEYRSAEMGQLAKQAHRKSRSGKGKSESAASIHAKQELERMKGEQKRRDELA